MQTTGALRLALPDQRIRLHMGGGNLEAIEESRCQWGAGGGAGGQRSTDAGGLTLKHLRDAALGQESLTFDAGVDRLRQG